jgi:tetratricopeptide (TPR) repeat protein
LPVWALKFRDSEVFPLQRKDTFWVIVYIIVFGLTGSAVTTHLFVYAQGGSSLILLPFLLLALIAIGVYWSMRNFRRLGPVEYLRMQLRWTAVLFGQESSITAHALYMIGVLHQFLNQPQEALAVYRSVLATYPQVNRDPRGACVHHAAGQMCLALDRPDLALEHFDTAFERYRMRRSDLRLAKRELLAMASVYQRMNKWELALEKQTKALELLQTHGLSQSADAARCLNTLGSTLECMGRQDEAVEKLKEGLAIYLVNAGDYPSSEAIAKLYEKIGSLLATKGDNRAAVENFRLAIEVHRRRGKSDESREVTSLFRKVSGL